MKPPRVMRVVAWMIALSIPAIVAFLFLVPWVQTAPGRGSVTALDPHDRVQQITALVPGRVEKWYVNDGQEVKAGDPIAQIVDNDPDVLTRMAAERAQVLAQIDSVAQAMAVARLDVERTRSLYADGLAARRDYENTQIKVAEHAAKLAEAKAKLSRVDIALNRQSAQVVRAPRDGVFRPSTPTSAHRWSARATGWQRLPPNIPNAWSSCRSTGATLPWCGAGKGKAEFRRLARHSVQRMAVGGAGHV
jgi:multidrug efflux pump subunit AcrA (membrane-fusion protein)